ncbi:sigma-70 family RNA polymerase sigma factor [Streptomyces sp. NPDC004610]|uniref:RNA polymerase sigma factor n=1 Tax=unclassified Streptomyces TaxID=2593676 RepID=UPI0033A97C41
MADDEALTRVVVRCQLGERTAFRELVDAWHTPVRRYVRGMTGDPQLADDLAQEVWIAVVRGLPRLRRPDRFAPWLFTIARRTVTDALRHKYRSAPETPLTPETHDTTDGPAADRDDPALTDVLTALELESALAALPPVEREVLLLFHLQDLPLAVCAEVLGVPPGTVKSRLHRARRLLRGALEEKGHHRA